MTEIVRATSADLQRWRVATRSILSEEQTAGAAASDAELAAALSDPRCMLLLAVSDGAPVGLLSAYVFPDVVSGGSLAYLYDIDVVEAQRRSGVGTSLVNALLALCREDGVKLVWAGTDAENRPARRTFERTGGELEGDRYVEYEWEID